MNPFGSRGKLLRSPALLVLLACLIGVAEGQHDKKSSSPAPRPAPAPHMSVSGIPCGRSKGRWAANQSGRGTGSLETSRVVYVSSVSLSNCAHLSKLI